MPQAVTRRAARQFPPILISTCSAASTASSRRPSVRSNIIMLYVRELMILASIRERQLRRQLDILPGSRRVCCILRVLVASIQSRACTCPGVHWRHCFHPRPARVTALLQVNRRRADHQGERASRLLRAVRYQHHLRYVSFNQSCSVNLTQLHGRAAGDCQQQPGLAESFCPSIERCHERLGLRLQWQAIHRRREWFGASC